ncbi:xylulokinase (plasmid) [Deinococcus aetherius]|uniref:Xylulokinase n=1 Tax=Deinococcus aetherius TaxID=200252 RepID=A0ABN6RK56_9DEIO|nr:FGGY family carbohydrate kinase [Deinococcus aetherius]BDP43715.1 xylulokinase [Deinococcus aetherius]
MREVLLGIDVGTTSAKAVLVTPTGQVVAHAESSYPTAHLRPGWVEQNPHDWWAATVRAVQGVLAGADSLHVTGIGVSGQGCAATLLDGRGEVVRPAIIWMDGRSEAQSAFLRAHVGSDILRLNGKTPAPYNADPVLMWLRDNERESLTRAAVSLTTTGYINYRLTGSAALSVADASILFAFDLKRGTWSRDLIEAFGLPERLYPGVNASCDVLGTLTSTAAAELGLRAGIPVVAGGEDTPSAALAAGVTEAGEAFMSLGTAGTVYVVDEQVRVQPRLLACAHVLPGRWMLGGSTVAFGAALAWCRDLLGPGLTLEGLTALAASSPPGAHGLVFLPYLSGELQPINDGHARGALVGLNFNHGAAHLVRAVMEGAAFALAHNLLLCREVGVAPREVRVLGGPTRSALWCQILADVTGCVVRAVPPEVGAPLGNALLAGQGVGLLADAGRTARANLYFETSFTPRPEDSARYAELFEVYRALYPQLRTSFAQLSAERLEVRA